MPVSAQPVKLITAMTSPSEILDAGRMIEARPKLRHAFEPHEEILVLDQRAVEAFPTDNTQLIERITLIRLAQVGELDVVELHLSVGTAPDDERRINRDAGSRRCRWRRRCRRGVLRSLPGR